MDQLDMRGKRVLMRCARSSRICCGMVSRVRSAVRLAPGSHRALRRAFVLCQG